MPAKRREGNGCRKGKSNERLFFRSLVLPLLFFFLITTGTLTGICEQRRFWTEGWSSQTEGTMAIARKYEEQEAVVEWGDRTPFHTTIINEQGIIHLNFTVLPYSNASVSFRTFIDFTTYTIDPVPENFTLAPGASYAEIYTLLMSGHDHIVEIVYVGAVLTEGANATVRWGYEVIKEGKG